ncbi:hypothetical protein EDD22DRAFT_1047432 [Suillus occidentalis]|nr:hypothetical protein EDD22DRAFT_1047432 [Suillus occidentalis]
MILLSICFAIDLTVLLQFPATSSLPHFHVLRTSAPLTTQSSTNIISPTLASRLLRLWPIQTNHAPPTIVDVPLAPDLMHPMYSGSLQQVLPGDDDDLIRDEDYVLSSSFPQFRLTPRNCQRWTAWERPVLFLLLTHFDELTLWISLFAVIPILYRPPKHLRHIGSPIANYYHHITVIHVKKYARTSEYMLSLFPGCRHVVLPSGGSVSIVRNPSSSFQHLLSLSSIHRSPPHSAVVTGYNLEFSRIGRCLKCTYPSSVISLEHRAALLRVDVHKGRCSGSSTATCR